MVSAYTQQMLRLRLPLTGPPPCGGLGGSRARVVEAVGVPAPRSRTRGSAREISLASAGQPWHRPAWDRLAKAPRGATVTVCVNAIPRIGRSQNSQGRRPPHLSLLGASTRPETGYGTALSTRPAVPGAGPWVLSLLHLTRLTRQAALGPASSPLKRDSQVFTAEPFGFQVEGAQGRAERTTRGCGGRGSSE